MDDEASGTAIAAAVKAHAAGIAKLPGWRKMAKKGLASLEEEPDEELDFHRGYYAKLDKVFALLLRRFSQTG